MNRKQRRAQAKSIPRSSAAAQQRLVPQAAPARPEPIRFAVATRETRESFVTNTATGRSLALCFDYVQLRLFP